MASNAILYVVLAIAAVLIIAYAAVGLSHGKAGTTRVAVQLTDPPTVPAGTQAVVVAYSSVDVHVSGAGNQSGWVSAAGSGSVNLIALTNMSQTIADADVAANSTIDLVRFNITSVKITVNNTTYNVASPNNQVTASVTGDQKINSSAAVLIDFYPTVNAQASGNGTAYVLVPAAKAVVVTANSTVSINTQVGSTASIGSGIRARLGLAASGGLCIGVGGGPCGGSGNGGANGSIESLVIVGAGQRVSNFMVESASYSSGTVSGLLYIEYPVAMLAGENTTLHINSTIGYACDNTEFRLSAIYSNGTAAFAHVASNTTVGGCPV
jgi:hypothetical protein